MAVKFSGKFTLWKMNGSDKLLEEHQTPNGKLYIDVMCSSASKSKAGDKYETDFNGKLRFWSVQAEKLKELDLKERDMIEVKEGTHTNNFDKNKNMVFSNYIVWDFEPLQKKERNAQEPTLVEPDEPFDPLADNSLPF